MMVSLSANCKAAFLAEDRVRGQVYYAHDHAVLTNFDDDTAEFEVEGSNHSYLVELDFYDISSGSLNTSCECMRFRDGKLCKHIWASLLAMDEYDQLGAFDIEREMHVLHGTEASQARQSTPTNRKQVPQPLETIPQPRPVEKKKKATQSRNTSNWKQQVATLARRVEEYRPIDESRKPHERLLVKDTQLWFVICQEDRASEQELLLRVYQSARKADGNWGVPARRQTGNSELAFEHPELRDVLRQMETHESTTNYRYSYQSQTAGLSVPAPLQGHILSRLAETERLVWTMSAGQHLQAAELQQLTWDPEPWQLVVHFELNAKGKAVTTRGTLVSNGETRDLSEVQSVFEDGLALSGSRLSPISSDDAAWLNALERTGAPTVPVRDFGAFLDAFSNVAHLPQIKIDDAIPIDWTHAEPAGKLVISAPVQNNRSHVFNVQPIAQYGDCELELDDQRRLVWLPDTKQLLRRNSEAEANLLEDLRGFPFQSDYNFHTGHQLTLPVRDVSMLTRALVEKGWDVIAHGKKMRGAASFKARVKSDNDWFDLEADVNFDGVSATLPAVLRALKNKQNFVVLDDGSHGILPEVWFDKYERLAQVGAEDGSKLRFAKAQALLLDAMLAEQENVSFDRDFTKLCKQLRNFDGIRPGKAPKTFQGTLRDYQADGVGWFSFLRDFGFGGCLADDMGLGKTIQVLALLEARRTRRLKKDEKRRPSLVVVPKSLVFNWIDEAENFTPKLNAINYTGLDRAERLTQLGDRDLLVTTYGTLRRDIEILRDIEFDYVVLDEAQAVKNASSQAAKACRLIHAQHRMAMTGTPIENHLGELWSLFDFLNPGMLGSSNQFKKLARANPEETDSLEWLAKAIRPFFLRRTKQQVLTELPQKTEQTLHCDMTPKQRKKYSALRDYYRAHLSQKVDDLGIKRSKIHVLEALLRLRQAACDPRLLDAKEPCGAKIELLVNQLERLLPDGHKALIFSQFTSLLALVKQEFDDRKWRYQYLDGKTSKRQEAVQHFQNDDECQLFLISLKAGGSGLNLTAADYVFILDPWWNPAVEAQAIDRAHRIGQTKSVMAYRIICNDTVEEKIIKMQASKRQLADAIITADKSLISELSMDDLQMLLG